MPEYAKLAFMETAEWWRGDQITSSRPLVQILAQILKDDPSYFPYSTFINIKSFEATLNGFQDKFGIRYIHIGCHGGPDGLDIGDSLIPPKSIIDNIDRVKFRGLFISACESNFLARNVAQEFDRPVWISGYQNKVDWLTSTAFEMLFWKEFIQNSNGRATQKQIEDPLKSMYKKGYKGVMEELGFCIYFRNKAGEIKELTCEEE